MTLEKARQEIEDQNYAANFAAMADSDEDTEDEDTFRCTPQVTIVTRVSLVTVSVVTVVQCR